MNRSMIIRHLRQAEQAVAQGARLVAEQEQRVSTLRRGGHDVAEAVRLLELFRETQAQHIAFRDRVLGELE